MHEGVMKDNSRCFTDDPIHEWFGLSYARYLTIPRTALQSMPREWQVRFTRCLKELDYAIDWVPEGKQYHVQLRDIDTGRIVPLSNDPLNDYDRGRRKVEVRGNKERETAGSNPYCAKCDNCGRVLGAEVLDRISKTAKCGCGGTYRLAGPSSNGRIPGCEPGEVGSIPTGPSKRLTLLELAKTPITSLNLKFRDGQSSWDEVARAITEWNLKYQATAYMRDMETIGALNYMRNWLGIYADAREAVGDTLGDKAYRTMKFYIFRIKRIRDTGFSEVW